MGILRKSIQHFLRKVVIAIGKGVYVQRRLSFFKILGIVSTMSTIASTMKDTTKSIVSSKAMNYIWPVTGTIAIVLIFVYKMGLVPGTDPFYHRAFERYYFGILGAQSCPKVIEFSNMMSDPGLADWTMSRDDSFIEHYPMAPLAYRVNPMQCVDSGEPIRFPVE
jgi:hypothetical protein